jgi:hypothetical protein
MAPVVDVRRIPCSDTLSSAAVCRALGDVGTTDIGLVRGSKVIVVGKCPPKEKVVRCNKI